MVVVVVERICRVVKIDDELTSNMGPSTAKVVDELQLVVREIDHSDQGWN